MPAYIHRHEICTIGYGFQEPLALGCKDLIDPPAFEGSFFGDVLLDERGVVAKPLDVAVTGFSQFLVLGTADRQERDARESTV